MSNEIIKVFSLEEWRLYVYILVNTEFYHDILYSQNASSASEVVYRQLIITIFRMPLYPMLNKANDPEYWLLIGRESGQVSHEY